MMNYYGYGHMVGGGWGMGIFNLFFGILIVVGIVILIRALFCRSGHCGHWRQNQMPDQDSAKQILRERYAKGEINKQEFEEKMKDLDSQK